MTGNSGTESQAEAESRVAARDDALWTIVLLRLLQLLIIVALWFLGPSLIKALGF